MEKMTIHRGLAELKLINSKIEKEIEQILPCVPEQNGKLMGVFIEKKDFEKNAQSNYDSILALIERKNKIKCAIVKKNAETKVTIAQRELTIAEAINFKSLVEFKKLFIESLKKKYQTVKANVEKNNLLVDQNCQKILEATFGKDNVKVDPSNMEAVKKPFMEMHQFGIYDPINTEEKIKTLEKSVLNFETEVDAVLSEINAVTFIEI